MFTLAFASYVFSTILQKYSKATINIEVNPPTFYLSNESVSENQYKLYINNLPSDVSGTLTIAAESSVTFVSDQLPTDKWYNSTWNLTLNVSTSGETTLEYYLLFSNSTSNITICSSNITVGQNGTYYHACNFTVGTIPTNPQIMLILNNIGNNTVTLYVDGSSKIEISKISS